MKPHIVVRLFLFVIIFEEENTMEECFKKIVCVCNRQECPYGKSHCCLGEVDYRCISDKVPLRERHCCKVKHGKKVIGTLAG